MENFLLNAEKQTKVNIQYLDIDILRTRKHRYSIDIDKIIIRVIIIEKPRKRRNGGNDGQDI